VLFGAVSISNDYSKASREMIYRFFEARMREDELAGMIEPRRPFRPAGLRPWDCRAMCHALRDLEELSQPITDVEADGKGLPILLRQYAKIGGKLLGFNVDRKFSNVLDGLVVVLERYMGREGAMRCVILKKTFGRNCRAGTYSEICNGQAFEALLCAKAVAPACLSR
jgi:hypothetical protein